MPFYYENDNLKNKIRTFKLSRKVLNTYFFGIRIPG